MKRTLWGGCLFILTGVMIINAAVISGTVSDSANNPLKNIRVSLRTTTSAIGVTITSDTTDSIGAYSMTCSDTLTGKYTVRTIDNNSPQVYFGQYDTVTLDGTAKTVNVKMSLIGKVTLSGTVTDSVSGAALKDVIVTIQSITGTITRTDTTDTLGKYLFDSVGSSTYTISTTAKGYNAASISKVVTTTATVDIKLSHIQYGVISGKVSDSATGEAVRGALVMVTKNYYQKIDSAVTDTAGQYVIDSIPVGSIKVTFSSTGYNSKTDSLSLTTAKPETLNVTIAKTVYLSFSGKVSDSASGVALRGVIVSFMSTSTFKTRKDTTDTNGNYVIDSLPVGTKKVNISLYATGYYSKADSITIDSTTSHTLNLVISKIVYFSVLGKISDSTSGAPIAGASVVLRQLQGYQYITMDSATTDSSGHYLIDSAFAGTSLMVSAAKHNIKSVQLTGTTSAPETVNVVIVSNVGVLMNSHFVRANQTISVASDRLLIKNVSEPGIIRLFNAKGEMIFNRSFKAGNTIKMNFANKMPFGTYVLKLYQKSGTFSKAITIR